MESKRNVSSQRSLILGGAMFLVGAVLTYAACSSQPPGATKPGTAGGSGGGATAGNGGAAGGVSGAGGTAGTGTGGGAGGTAGTGAGGVAGDGTGAGGAAGMDVVPPPPNDATCTAFTPTRANKLSPVDPQVQTLMSQMSVAQKLSVINGDPSACGPPVFNCDFDGTGLATTNPAITPFKMRDGPRGVHDLGNGKTSTWAVAEARAASFDEGLELRVGQAQGQEMRALKYDMSLAPVVNTLRHPLWARAQETYGEDPLLVGRMGAAFTNGLQQYVAACPKHFVGNDTDNNRQSVIVNMDEQTLRENYALPFQILVENADPACIMAAYNGFNGTNATESPHLFTDILRTDWKWTGLVISDWWATKNNGVRSINAGLDYEMPNAIAFLQLPSAIGTTVTAARVDEAVTRMLNVRIKFGQLTAAYINSPANPGIVNDQVHKDLARETEEKGAILLKNDGVLPLGPKATVAGSGLPNVKSIIFLGPDANLPDLNEATADTAGLASGLGDRGSSDTDPPYAVSFIAGLRAHPAVMAGGITIATNAAASAASQAEVVIIPVSMAHEDEGEAYNGGRDRQDLTLSGVHPIHWGATKPSAFIRAAAAANPNAKIVVLLSVGAAVVMEDWWMSAHAIIHTFYPGQEGGNALARLLFGDVNFSAKLPFTVAQNPADYPTFQNAAAQATTDYFHGYRKFEKEAKVPRFYFGYGMSYTKYAYSNLQVLCSDGITATGRLNVSVNVKNTGTMAGDEVVELYIGYPNTTARRPVKELKAYTRVNLMPGQEKVVALSVAAKDMAYWNMATNAWTVEKLQHKVLVGPSSDPANLLSANFTIK